MLLALLFLLPSTVHADQYDVTIGLEPLAGETDADYYNRLFVQCGTWLAQYKDVQLPAKEKLIAIGTPALEVLVPRWLSSDDVRHRVTMEEIVNGIGPPAVPVLVPYAIDENATMRQRVAGLIGGLDHPESLPTLRARLGVEDDILVLPSLIEGVGKRGAGAEGLVEPLTEYLSHEDERLRRNTAVAMGRIGDSVAIAVLLPLLDDPMFTVRYPARDALWVLSTGVDSNVFKGHRPTEEGFSLQTELMIARKLANDEEFKNPGWLDDMLAPGTEQLTKVSVLRGVLRAWLADHAKIDPITTIFTDRYDDPMVEAVGREALRTMTATLLAEAKAAEVAAAAGE